MADNKQYVTHVQSNGNVLISEDVIATIVAHAVAEVKGVVGLSTKPGADIAELIGKKSWGKGLRIAIAEDNSVSIGCNVIVIYGESVVDVAKAIQEAVTNAVESVTGVAVKDVHVNVCGIVRQ